MSAPRVLDLFSGAGGMSWGLHLKGFEVVGAMDHWPKALATFEHNHPGARTFAGDIREFDPADVMDDLGLEPGELEVIVGGPPCQGFSRNVTASRRFLDDPRNQLFRDYLRFVAAMQPRVVVMENVAEFYGAYGGSVREQVLTTLADMGYAASAQVLTAADYGVPQRRRRTIIVASRSGRTPVFPVPTHGPRSASGTPYVSAWEAISDLAPLGAGESSEHYAHPPAGEFQRWVRHGSTTVTSHSASRLSAVQQARYDALEPGQAIRDLPDDLRPKSGYSGAYGRLDFTSVAPTITRWCFHIGSGRFGHPAQRRLITMREAARIQSFTDDFEFLGSRNDVAGQIGNAVPPRLMVALAPMIRELVG